MRHNAGHSSAQVKAWNFHVLNNLSSYCGLVDARIRVSDKDLPVQMNKEIFFASFVTKKLPITN